MEKPLLVRLRLTLLGIFIVKIVSPYFLRWYTLKGWLNVLCTIYCYLKRLHYFFRKYYSESAIIALFSPILLTFLHLLKDFEYSSHEVYEILLICQRSLLEFLYNAKVNNMSQTNDIWYNENGGNNIAYFRLSVV